MAIDRAVKYKWARALLTEVHRPRQETTPTFDKKYGAPKKKTPPKRS